MVEHSLLDIIIMGVLTDIIIMGWVGWEGWRTPVLPRWEGRSIICWGGAEHHWLGWGWGAPVLPRRGAIP